MKNSIRSAVLAIAVLAFALPDAAQAQAQPPKPAAAPAPAPAVQPKGTAKRAPAPTAEARWTSMLNSMAVLAQEGFEVKRITTQEKAQIDRTITNVTQQIRAARAGGISEVEEDAIDTAIAAEMTVIAKAMTDEPRKKANPIPLPAKK